MATPGARCELLCGIAAVLLTALVPAIGYGDEAATWVTLGTSGGPAAQSGAAQISNALVVGESIFLFDVGDGVRRQMAEANLPANRVRAIFISHHHVDHNADLGPVIISNWIFSPDNRITILGPPGTTTLVDGLVEASRPVVQASFPVAGPEKPELAATIRVVELPSPLDEPKVVYEDANIQVSAITVDHYQVAPSVPMDEMPVAVAYRVEAAGRSIVYTGDTGVSARLALLAEGADILVSEVVDVAEMRKVLGDAMQGAPKAVIERLVENLGANHLAPEDIGRMATRAGINTVVLTHFVPAPRDEAQGARYREGVRSTFDGQVYVARDLDRF